MKLDLNVEQLIELKLAVDALLILAKTKKEIDVPNNVLPYNLGISIPLVDVIIQVKSFNELLLDSVSDDQLVNTISGISVKEKE